MTKASRVLLYSAIAITAADAWAQQPPPPQETTPAPDATPVIKIEVTGSRIMRVEGENALPVQTITRDDWEKAGWTSVEELMAHISANLNGFNDQLSVGNMNPGNATVSLRGLGASSTLVLLNGRRLSNYAFVGEGVDIKSIPLAALDRIEILKDGASSIYGTDAIAGVVNFITRKDYRGAEVALQGSQTQHGGGDHRQATVSAGAGNLAADRFNAFVTFDWQKDTALHARDRPFSRTVYLPDQGIDELSNATFPANIYGPHSQLFSPALASGCAPPVSLVHVRFTGQTVCGYDYATVVDDVPPTERYSVFGRGTFRLSPDHDLFAEYLYTHNDLLLSSAASPTLRTATQAGDPIFYPVDGPYYPTAFAAANNLHGDLPIAFRTVALGPRDEKVRTTGQRILVGAEGDLSGWTYNAAYNHSENTATDSYRSGAVSITRLVAAMATGLINPFGPSTPEGDALLQSTQIYGQVRSAKGAMDEVDARASRDLFSLPAGPLAIAVGAEGRRERLMDRPTDILTSGDLLGGAGEVEPQDASRRVEAAFVELNVPLAKSVEAQLSARYDHYSDFGSTTNPKIALRWQPMKSLLFRGAWGTGFRAPSLPELYTQQTGLDTADGMSDPVRCPVTGADADCALEYTVFSGGNRHLQPERSHQYSAGVVWEPVAGSSIAIDYWNIDKRSVIDTLGDDIIFANFAVYAPTNIIRGPVDPAFPNLPGPITGVISYDQNVGNVRTSGIDVDASARIAMGQAGRLALHLNGTWVAEWQQSLNGINPQSLAGAYGLDGPIPRWRQYASAIWERGSWATTLAETFQSGYVDANPDLNGNPRRVGTYDVWDLQEAYSGFRNITLTAGVRNLFDRAPPATNQIDTVQVGYDPRYADPRGRAFYLRIAYSFR